jgi:transposase-like protein
MKGKTYVRYSESFKREVVHKIQHEGLGIPSARRLYGIGSEGTISRWLRRYGDPRLMSTKIIVMKSKEISKEQQQAKRIKELEAALVELQLKHLESESYLKVAVEELGQDLDSFKKKAGPKDSAKP